jgi:hypothetical protein
VRFITVYKDTLYCKLGSLDLYVWVLIYELQYSIFVFITFRSKPSIRPHYLCITDPTISDLLLAEYHGFISRPLLPDARQVISTLSLGIVLFLLFYLFSLVCQHRTMCSLEYHKLNRTPKLYKDMLYSPFLSSVDMRGFIGVMFSLQVSFHTSTSR